MPKPTLREVLDAPRIKLSLRYKMRWWTLAIIMSILASILATLGELKPEPNHTAIIICSIIMGLMVSHLIIMPYLIETSPKVRWAVFYSFPPRELENLRHQAMNEAVDEMLDSEYKGRNTK